MPRRKIHTRGLTSFFTLFGFIIMAITGLILYIVPAGRVAYWVNWEMMGMTKTQWGNIHILSSLLFIVAGAFHTYFNWKPLMNYFKDRVSRGVKLGRELAIASAVSVLIIISSLLPVPPLNYLLDFNEFVKESWIVADDYEPPFGHAEMLSLKSFAKKMEIDLVKAAGELKANGVHFQSTEETLEDIAESNGTSPMNLYLLIKKFEPVPEPVANMEYTPEMVEVELAGTGFGNKSFKAVCEKIGIDSLTAVQRLKAAGIAVSWDKTLKAAAESHDLTPIELVKVMLIESYQPQRD